MELHKGRAGLKPLAGILRIFYPADANQINFAFGGSRNIAESPSGKRLERSATQAALLRACR